MIKCPGCGRTYSNLVKVCPACKTALNSQSQELPQYGSSENSSTVKLQPNNAGTVCPNCGATVQGGAKFCGSCGGRVTPEAPKIVQNTPAPATISLKSENNKDQKSSNASVQQSVPVQTTSVKSNEKSLFEELTNFSTDGRLSRSKYWKCVLPILIISIFIPAIALKMGVKDPVVAGQLINLFCFIVCFHLNVKRLHDLNRSGWFMLITLIPIVNYLFYIYLLAFKGTDGPNKYGPDSL